MEYDKTAAGAPIGSMGCRCFMSDICSLPPSICCAKIQLPRQMEACARRGFVCAVGIAPYAKMMGKQKLRKPSPRGDFPAWNSAETPQAFPLEGKVARLYAATDEVEKGRFIRLVVVCETETYATNILRKPYGSLTPHPPRCAQHLFLPKTGPFCRLRRHFPRTRGNYLKGKACGVNRFDGIHKVVTNLRCSKPLWCKGTLRPPRICACFAGRCGNHPLRRERGNAGEGSRSPISCLAAFNFV